MGIGISGARCRRARFSGKFKAHSRGNKDEVRSLRKSRKNQDNSTHA
jgi:hypothetical protein